MPKLWKLDDYDDCLQSPGPEEPPGVYCANTVVIRPDNRSELWRLIEYKFDETVFENSGADRAMYEDMVEICINKELNETYGLMAYTEVQSCDKSSMEMDIDTLDQSFLIIFCLLISLVIFSTWYDSSINYKRIPDHYKQPLDSKRKMVCVAFSLQRNWYRLTSRSSSEMNKKLRFFQAIRFLTITLVIFGHAGLLMTVSPTINPEKMEKLMHDIGSMILTNGVQITQTFLAMSGTLLAIQFLNFSEQRKSRVGYLYVVIAIVIRYIRLTPAYAFVLLFHATWLVKLQVGPLWRWGVETERVFCRRNWWTNLLYINNYVHADKPCLQQGWYLGAEFQIFIVAVFVLITIVKFPRLKTAILALVLAVSYALPALFIYFNKLDGTFVITLEAQRYIFWFDRNFLQAFIPTHVNFGNYMMGVLTGLMYTELQKRSIDLAHNRPFRIIWYLNFLIIPLTMLPSYMFYVNDFEKPSIWMAVYFAVLKNLFGIGACIFFLGSIFRINKVLQRMLNYPFFEPLGRLTYGAYLSHALVMRYMFVSVRGPVYYSLLLAFSLVAGSLVLSCLIALLLCFLVEFPTSALQSILFDGFKARKTTNQVDPEDVNVADQPPASAPEAEAKRTDL
ncbi:AGAP007074-PA-like protein [Anopheles sinensis]|uniref:AGAP007074-PA-like protein n=1 Tax=Anopheles sinensis TaxID=74873 RepID=A0A084WED6_ANOSI|nr:AGAP007074-PA-like protein [Anopheles sinensis]